MLDSIFHQYKLRLPVQIQLRTLGHTRMQSVYCFLFYVHRVYNHKRPCFPLRELYRILYNQGKCNKLKQSYISKRKQWLVKNISTINYLRRILEFLRTNFRTGILCTGSLLARNRLDMRILPWHHDPFLVPGLFRFLESVVNVYNELKHLIRFF